MASNRCMNAACGATEPGGGAGAGGGEWKRGWQLRSNGFATLCLKCGMAYEQSVFCDMFHQNESGWRDCLSCGKHLHCGCIASKSSFDLLDSGGVQCTGCLKKSESSVIPNGIICNFLPQHQQRVFAISDIMKDEKVKDTERVAADSIFDLSSLHAERKVNTGAFAKEKSTSSMGPVQQENKCGPFEYINWENMALKLGNVGLAGFTNRYQSTGSSQMFQKDKSTDAMTNKIVSESPSQECLSISLGSSNQSNRLDGIPGTDQSIIGLPPQCAIASGQDQNMSLSSFQQVQKAHSFLLKPPKAGNGIPSEASKDALPQMRVARPPAEGRSRNQLLPRYWPRITDQELQQISGDSNCTIVPLFEKVLSASDAGRIGRLVLPKACAEAYFPPISQPEGLPVTIQDSKGKEWHFQFRFWPNNNSRMYVLEGVTPCIQSLQLQAGDTVTFSRIDPEGKLVMGYRKATNNTPLQDSQISAIANGTIGNEAFFSGMNVQFPVVSGYSGHLQQMKGTVDLHMPMQTEHLNFSDGDISWYTTDKYGGNLHDGLQMSSYKRSRNIGASRRLLMDRDDALELKLTWEEAQDLLRPPPSVKPSIVMIEDHVVEEYEEPPVFGKRTIFTARTSGEQDQWVQCDDCSKWRRSPIDVLLPSKWTCADNTWDPNRNSCSAPDDLSPKEVQILLQQSEDFRKQMSCVSLKQTSLGIAASSYDALEAAAVLGDSGNQPMSSVATTTKHPRHRPGCTCIVCIQPPSGKGPKHNPSCTCNVCMTVKRRFKTLMMRKKMRQSEREEAETNKRVAFTNKDETEGTSSSLKGNQPLDSPPENDYGTPLSSTIVDKLDMNEGQIDLNFHPRRGDGNTQVGPPKLSMMSLLQVANRPLEAYLKQNGLTSLACEEGNQERLNSMSVPSPLRGNAQDDNQQETVSDERDGTADVDAEAVRTTHA